MNELCKTIEHGQKELNSKLNILEAESKLVLLILERINKGGKQNATSN